MKTMQLAKLLILIGILGLSTASSPLQRLNTATARRRLDSDDDTSSYDTYSDTRTPPTEFSTTVEVSENRLEDIVEPIKWRKVRKVCNATKRGAVCVGKTAGGGIQCFVKCLASCAKTLLSCGEDPVSWICCNNVCSNNKTQMCKGGWCVGCCVKGKADNKVMSEESYNWTLNALIQIVKPTLVRSGQLQRTILGRQIIAYEAGLLPKGLNTNMMQLLKAEKERIEKEWNETDTDTQSQNSIFSEESFQDYSGYMQEELSNTDQGMFDVMTNWLSSMADYALGRTGVEARR